jgi:hypothetical protein
LKIKHSNEAVAGSDGFVEEVVVKNQKADSTAAKFKRQKRDGQ